MPRKSILANETHGPAATQLRTHAEERGNLLESLTCSFEEDRRIRAAWLWGSSQRGEQDDLSDLDLWLLIQDDAVGSFGDSVTDHCHGAGTVVSAGENPRNAPAGGGYLGALLAGTHGLHHLDIYWQPITSAEMPPGRLLLNRTAEQPQLTPTNSRSKRPEPDPNAGRIAYLWLMLSVTAKHLARDPNSDMVLLLHPKNAFEETATALGLEHLIAQTNWQIPEQTDDKVDALRHIARQTAILEKACPSASPDANPCLMSYFDLVEAIIRTA